MEQDVMSTSEVVGVDIGINDTISQYCSARVPVVSLTATVTEMRDALAGRRFDSVDSIAVCTNDLLEGVIRIEDLLAAHEHLTASEIMDASPPVVGARTHQEAAAWKAVHHGEATLAVVDDIGRFCGFVPPHRLLAVLLREHDEDAARWGGFLHDASLARLASRERVWWRYWHRMPWLLIGLAGAFLAAAIVGSYEKQIGANVVIAFFIPGIVYMADAVGTQTETLVVRGLSVGVSIREVVRRE